MDANKEKALDAALSQIERQFGKGSIMRMGDTSQARDIEAISTSLLAPLRTSARSEDQGYTHKSFNFLQMRRKDSTEKVFPSFDNLLKE